MPRKPRQTEIEGAEKPKVEGIDDELVVQVQQETEAWQKLKAAAATKRELLLQQMRRAGVDEYETHDGYSCSLKRGSDKVSVRKPKDQDS